MRALISQIALVYSITLLICSSSFFAPVRQWFIRLTPQLYSPLALIFKSYIPDREEPPRHFIECRMCVGIWVTLISCCIVGDCWSDYWIIFGASYFLATQER
jgi:hypothetical protein